jgi:TetR/AcrR family transcriptional regulator
MNDTDNINPKDRIIKVAASLFAYSGFAAVGVREIAAKADVNISMISYYFGGKIGILKAIIEEYFNYQKDIIKDIIEKKLPAEDNLRLYVKEMVKLIRSNRDLCHVAILELPLNIPEISDFKIRLLQDHVKLVKAQFDAYPKMKNHNSHFIIGPALITLIFSNFLIGDTSKGAFNVEFDDEFYERYSDTIATLFLRGIIGVAEEAKLKDELCLVC